MKKIIFLLTMILTLSACEKETFVDDTEFALHYMGINDIQPGEVAVSTPSYKGVSPGNFRIYSIMLNNNIFYNPKIDGELDGESSFYVDPVSGSFKIQKTSGLKPGTYRVSISCSSAGKEYSFPDAIIILMTN